MNRAIWRAAGRSNKVGRKTRHSEEAMLSIRQIHPVFVGEVLGADLTRPLTAFNKAVYEKAG